MTMTSSYRSDRERGAQILNRNEQTRLNRVIDHLTLSKRLHIKSLEQQQHVFRVQSQRKFKSDLETSIDNSGTVPCSVIAPQPIVMVTASRVLSTAANDSSLADTKMTKSILKLGQRRRDVTYFFHHDLEKVSNIPDNHQATSTTAPRRHGIERPRAETTSPYVQHPKHVEEDPVQVVANEQRSRSAPLFRPHSTLPFFDRSLAMLEIRQFLRDSAHQRSKQKCPIQRPNLRDEATYQRHRFNGMRTRVERFYTDMDQETKNVNQQSILLSGFAEEPDIQT